MPGCRCNNESRIVFSEKAFEASELLLGFENLVKIFVVLILQNISEKNRNIFPGNQKIYMQPSSKATMMQLGSNAQMI